ncbi:MAG TPA: SsrA-binding protein SmpB [Patescibacteria group bacterium]|nr:SsrA-binding protein SmpB [Patescibacteria group bacterium]
MKITNKKARFNYQITDSFEAGIVLSGHEVKSLRSGHGDLSESFAKIQNGEVYLKNAFIPAYQNASIRDYDPKRERKLLLHRDQIRKLAGSTDHLIPLSIYEKRNMFKVDLGIGTSKKQFDKRKTIKARDEARRIEQELRGEKGNESKRE